MWYASCNILGSVKILTLTFALGLNLWGKKHLARFMQVSSKIFFDSVSTFFGKFIMGHKWIDWIHICYHLD
jgi:hypothetical protein